MSQGSSPNTYTYDANGNAISRNGAAINWTSYNLPSLINGASNNSSAFSYGPDRQRWKQQASYSGTSETTLYLGGLLEKVTLGSVTSWRHHVLGGDGEVAIHTRKSDGSNETHYLSTDHLGSTDAITNAAGAVMARTSFSAFGQRRNATGWSGNPTSADSSAITATTRHGYTGHDMLDNLNLTHMNGRVYDQITGRFLSADPFVQDPFNGQSLNRYSYVFNNPLRFIDPSGFQGTEADEGGGSDPSFRIDIRFDGLPFKLLSYDPRGKLKHPNARSTAPARGIVPSQTSASAVRGSDFKSFALGFAAGIDFDLPTEEGETYTEGFYAGLIANALTANIQDLKNGRVGSGSGRRSGSRLTAGSGVNLGKAAPRAKSTRPPGGGLNAGGSNPKRDFVLFHGTSLDVAKRLLAGEALDAERAAGLKVDGPEGFFLATDPDAAEFFALRRGTGAVLQYRLTADAFSQLTKAGATLGPIAAGKSSRIPGEEFVIPPRAFGLFNSLRSAGAITVTP